MTEDDIIHIKEQLQILHERLEHLEQDNRVARQAELRQLQTQINNVKLALYEIKKED